MPSNASGFSWAEYTRAPAAPCAKMSFMTSCKCGLLAQYANDPAVPVGFDSGAGEYFIKVVPGLDVKISCCFFCGGDFPVEPSHACRCGELERWTEVEKSSIRYDRSLREYYLEYDSTKLHFYYCPFCRGALPTSKSDSLFVEPSPDEMSSINQKLSGMTTINQVIAELGEPDERRQRSTADLKDESLYNVLAIYETILYKALFRTFHLCVQETLDGRIMVSFLRKLKNNAGSPSASVAH